tara:strand:+ start:41 stop:763 length:723 start_codon:yes stop_codon:yes gene_type:complete
MKTAICFTGTGRSLDYTYENLKQNLISKFDNCDVFILGAENAHSDKIIKYFKNKKFVKSLTIEKEPNYDLSNLRFRPNWPGSKLSSRQVYIKMIQARKRMEQIISSHETKNNILYERIIFSRLDVRYFDNVYKHVADIDSSVVYIPDFHNEFGGVINGYNDRFAVGNRENMKVYFSIPDSVHAFMANGGNLHAETLLKWHMLNRQVKVMKIPVRFTRVRPDGTEEDTRIENIHQWNFGDT